MECSLNKNELRKYISAQLDHFFSDQYRLRGTDVEQALDFALERLSFCFKHITVPGYIKNGMPYFYHLHSDQYSQFLYYLMCTAQRKKAHNS